MSLTIGASLSTFLPDCAEDVPAKLIDAGTAARIEARSLAPLPEAIQALLSHVSPSLPGELPPGKLHPVGFDALPPSALALLRAHREQEAECVFADKSQGKCLVWPVPGDRSRAWALLPHGRCMELKRMASNNKQGYVYIDHLQRGGTSPIVLNIQPAMTLEAIEVENRNIIPSLVKSFIDPKQAEDTIPSIRLELPQGLLDVALSKLRDQDKTLWRDRLVKIWQSLPDLKSEELPSESCLPVWGEGRGEAKGRIFLKDPQMAYTVGLWFKGDSAAADPLAMPKTGWVDYFKIVDKKANSFVLDEEDWLRHELEQNGIELPTECKFWRSPGNRSQPVYLDSSRTFVEPPEASEISDGEEDEENKEDKNFDVDMLGKKALDALTIGGAYQHTLVMNVGAYWFRWKDAAFEVNYHLDESRHGTSWMGIFHNRTPVAVCGTAREVVPDIGNIDVWCEHIAGLGDIEDSGRNAMIGYYLARDSKGKMAISPPDGYLAAPIEYIVFVQETLRSTVAELRAKTYEERVETARQYFKDENKERFEDRFDVAHQRRLLSPFMVWLKDNKRDTWCEDIDDVQWTKRFGSAFKEKLEEPRNRKALIEYLQEMHAVGMKASTLKSEATRLVVFLKHLENKKVVLDNFVRGFAGRDDMEKYVQNFCKTKTDSRLIHTIMPFLDTRTGKVSLSNAQKLPAGDQNKKDLESFIAWLYPEVNQANMTQGTFCSNMKAILANWICRLERSLGKDTAVRDLVVAIDDEKDFKKIWNTGRAINKTIHTYLRMFSVWAHLQVYLADPKNLPPGDVDASKCLNDWLLWRKDNVRHDEPGRARTLQAGKGAWQLIEQFRVMTDQEWSEHVEMYLGARKMDDPHAPKASLNSFREWVRKRHSWTNQAVPMETSS